MTTVKRRAIAMAMVAASVLAACGSDDTGSSDSAEPATDAGGGGATELTIVGTDFAFDPSSADIAADTDVTVTLQNDGAIAHQLSVLEAGVTVASEADFDEGTVVATIDEIDGGADASTTVNLAAGSYQVICAVVGHLDAGMEATLNVQ